MKKKNKKKKVKREFKEKPFSPKNRIDDSLASELDRANSVQDLKSFLQKIFRTK